MTREQFLKLTEALKEALHGRSGDLSICLYLFNSCESNIERLIHFKDSMEPKYFPSGSLISVELSLNPKNYPLSYTELRSLILETRLKCVNEWRDICLESNTYEEF